MFKKIVLLLSAAEALQLNTDQSNCKNWGFSDCTGWESATLGGECGPRMQAEGATTPKDLKCCRY